VSLGQYNESWGQFGVEYNYIMLSKNSDIKNIEEQLEQFKNDNVGMGMASFISFEIQSFANIYFTSNLNNELEPRGDLKQVYIFSIVAFLIILIASLNFVNLSTARSFHRAKEVGLRKVFGSARWELIKQFITESVLLTLLAMIIGLIVFGILYPHLNNFIGKELSMSSFRNPVMYIVIFLMSILVGILSGIYPAFYLSGFKPIDALKAKSGKRKTLFRKIMVIIQFTIAISLIIITIIIYKQLHYLKTVDKGYNNKNKMVIQMGHGSDTEKGEIIKASFERIAGVSSVSYCFSAPGGLSTMMMNTSVETADSNSGFMINGMPCDENYIPLLEIEMAEGENFAENSKALNTVIINEAAVKEFGFEDPLGKKIMVPNGQRSSGPSEVIGVVKDFNFASPKAKISPMMMYQNSDLYSSLIIGYDDLAKAKIEMEKSWKEVFPETPFEYAFLDELNNRIYASEEKMGKLFIFFSLLIVFVSCLGIFGLASFIAEQKTKEIGIRKVMGASVSRIVLHLSKDFVIWASIANVLAFTISYYLMDKWLQNFALKTKISFGIFIASGAIAIIIALLTISIQSFNAATKDPVKTLKYE